MNSGPTETIEKLQMLEQGKLHQLGDDLLPSVLPFLQDLNPHGINEEGKTTKGVPDSYVGSDPKSAVAAVEYTTQADRLQKKFAGDFSSVRTSCPSATHIVLCTNRRIDGLDLDTLRQDALAQKIALEVVGAERLALLT